MILVIGCLALLATVPEASARKVKVKRRSVKRMLQDTNFPIEGEFFKERNPQNGFPGQVFFEDNEAEQSFISKEITWREETIARQSSPTPPSPTPPSAPYPSPDDTDEEKDDDDAEKGKKSRKKSSKAPTTSYKWKWKKGDLIESGCGKTKSSKKSSKKSSRAPSATRSPKESASPVAPSPPSPPSPTPPYESTDSDSGKGKGKGKGKGGARTEGVECPEDGESGSGKAGDGSEGYPTMAPNEGAPSPPTSAPVEGAPSPPTNPTISPGGGDPTIDVPSPDASTCANIQSQTPPSNPTGETSDFVATLNIDYLQNNPFTQAGVIGLLDSINPVIALWVAGCETEAEALAQTLRRLQEGSVEYVGIDKWSVTGGSCSVSDGETCSENFKTDIEVTADPSISEDTILKRIQEAFEIFGFLIGDQPGIDFDPTGGDVNVEKGDDFDSIIDGPGAAVDDSVNVATVIGASAGGLALILLLVLLVRRTQNEDEVSHLKLDDEGDETFVREFDSASGGSENYETRNVHVVGEADSIFSGWTGYTPAGKNGVEVIGGLNPHEKGDVHYCSSATCEVCEQRRQQGIQFIPTSQPSRPQIPSDASRQYVSNDTVEL